MTRIRLEPLPNAQAHLVSGAGAKPDVFLFSETSKQLLVFPIRLANSVYNSVMLATGEPLSEIEGYARLHRGVQYTDAGERMHDELRYNGPTQADEDGPAKAASFAVTAFLDDWLFDQTVMLCQSTVLPIIDLKFNLLSSSVTYGDASDGSEVIWNNDPRVWESIEGITLTHALVKGSQ